MHIQDKADKVIKGLIDKGIMEKVEGATQFVSHGFFVPRPGANEKEVEPRLVVDYTHVNKFIDRPGHPFPSTKQVLQRIRSDSKCFIKLDAKSGYWQAPIKKECCHLTTFIVGGKYAGKYAFT